jgi:hypothetical protein
MIILVCSNRYTSTCDLSRLEKAVRQNRVNTSAPYFNVCDYGPMDNDGWVDGQLDDNEQFVLTTQ